jgi:hypothetical protein
VNGYFKPLDNSKLLLEATIAFLVRSSRMFATFGKALRPLTAPGSAGREGNSTSGSTEECIRAAFGDSISWKTTQELIRSLPRNRYERSQERITDRTRPIRTNTDLYIPKDDDSCEKQQP